MNTRYGAGDRTRTGTLSPAEDFESSTSTIPSHRHLPGYYILCGAKYQEENVRLPWTQTGKSADFNCIGQALCDMINKISNLRLEEFYAGFYQNCMRRSGSESGGCH